MHRVAGRKAFCRRISATGTPLLSRLAVDSSLFGKTPAQNCYLLNKLSKFAVLKRPILIGASRKTLIYRTLNISTEDSLAGSLAAATLAGANGASIIRAHDVKETVQAVKMSIAIS